MNWMLILNIAIGVFIGIYPIFLMYLSHSKKDNIRADWRSLSQKDKDVLLATQEEHFNLIGKLTVEYKDFKPSYSLKFDKPYNYYYFFDKNANYRGKP